MGYAKEDTGPYSVDAEASPNGSQEQLIVKPIKSWKGYVWDTWELPKDQRWLLFKLDAFVLTFASVIPQILSLRKKTQAA
jgi:ACS family pantothenate transporter-like MFS transporter